MAEKWRAEKWGGEKSLRSYSTPLALWSLDTDNKGQRPDLYQPGATPQVKCAQRVKIRAESPRHHLQKNRWQKNGEVKNRRVPIARRWRFGFCSGYCSGVNLKAPSNAQSQTYASSYFTPYFFKNIRNSSWKVRVRWRSSCLSM